MLKVTVIIPTFNRSAFIPDAIKSVLDQNYENIEIIVVDDGSTDDTQDKLSSWIKLGVIRYEFQENRGRSAARNRGISLASGDYLAFLDSDDLFEHGKLKTQVDLFSRNPEIGLLHSGYCKFNEFNDNLGYRDPSWFSGWIYPEILLKWNSLLATPTVMVPKHVMEEMGGFDESLYIGEDLDMWRRIARRYPFGYINQSLARIRVHSGNTSSDAIAATREFERYLQKAFDDDPGLSDSFRRRALSRMYGNQAYIMLSSDDPTVMSTTRTTAKLAIHNDPFNVHGYIGFISTWIGYTQRRLLVQQWRTVRGWVMSRNRQG